MRVIVAPHHPRADSVTTFTVASTEFLGGGKGKAAYHHKGKGVMDQSDKPTVSPRYVAVQCSSLG